MSAYEALAFSYDALTYDIAYDQALDFMEKILGQLGKKPQTVVELACGTGSMTVRLAKRGYTVTGMDISQEMLTVAYDKVLELEKNRPLLVQQSMQELDLPAPVDMVVCFLDSINYLTHPADCRETFRRVFENLKAGGVFLFDINSAEKLRQLDGQVFLDETDDAYCVWRAAFEEDERTCYYGFDLFQREGELWKRSFEEHAEYAYEAEELAQWLRDAGFMHVALFGDRKLSPPQPEEQRIFFAAMKESL